MTSQQLAALVYPQVSAYLGSYAKPGGATIAALWYYGRDGLSQLEPPSDWDASGVELRIAAVPEVTLEPQYAQPAVAQEFRCYLVLHGNDVSGLDAALRAILRNFDTDTPALLRAAQDPQLLTQYSFTIRSS